MANKIQIRRGLKSAMPTGSSGEPLWASDTRELYMGTGAGNVNMGGSHWYRGTALSGTSATANAYSYGACPEVKLDDIYLNTTNGNLYACTTAGKGNTAKWTYQGCIKGATGDAGDYFPTNGYVSMDELSIDVSDMKEERLAPPTTITIGCVDSKHQWLVDYNTYNFESADEALQQAINALPPSGGKISILEGEYMINEPLTCNKDVVFEGMGDATVINVTGGISLITNTASCNIEFYKMKMSANDVATNTKGLFDIVGSTRLYLNDLRVESNISTGAVRNGTVISGTGARIYCNRVDINVDILPSFTGDCYMVFRNSGVYGNMCNIQITRNSDNAHNAAIFYNCGGAISNGRLISTSNNAQNAILSDSCDMLISTCNVECHAISQDSSAYCGRMTNCKIKMVSGYCFCDVSDCEITLTGTMYFNGQIFTNNKVINASGNSIRFRSNSIVSNNISKCTLASSTPSGGVMNNNVVLSSLS